MAERAARGSRASALHPYVSALAADVITTSPSPRAIRVGGTLACFDVAGFSTLAERLAGHGRAGAEHVNDVLNDVFGVLIGEVHDHGGDVLEFGGDAMVVLFRGDDASLRATVAAARLIDAVESVRPVVPSGAIRVEMSCGISSGEQAYHLVGERRRALMVAGPVSSRMARLQEAATSGQVLLDEPTAAALPAGWTTRVAGAWRLRRRAVDRVRPQPTLAGGATGDVELLIPMELRGLSDVGRRSGELKLVAVGFVLLDGVDGPDEVTHDRLRTMTATVEEAAAAHGVCWLETQVGDDEARWTLIAGAPVATERDPERLLGALHDIAERSVEPVRIGANFGDVFVGDMGHTDRCTFITMGDTTNVAARLMGIADRGQILVGERLAAVAAHGFSTTPVGELHVKGRRRPVVASLVGPRIERWRHDGGEGGVPLIGREAELATLRDALAAGRVVELVGDAGAGKTRLWKALRQIDLGRVWHAVEGEPDETASPYAAIGRLIRDRASAAGHDVGAAALLSLAAEVAPEQLRWLPLVAEAVGVSMDTTVDVDRLADDYRGDRTRTALAEFVTGIIGAGGVLVVEDAHWLDEPSLAVLGTVRRSLPPDAALLMVTRPGQTTGTADAVVELGPLTPTAADQLVLGELPTRLASDERLSRVRETAAGNPLFLLELARREARGAASLDGLPESVQRLLAARIDELPPRGRGLIRDLAVLGARVDLRLAARVLARRDLLDDQSWVSELGDLVTVVDRAVSFRHDLVRVAAYEGQSDRRRRDLHRAACAVLDAWGPNPPVADTVAALAYHAAGSGDPELLVRWGRLAAESALARGGVEVARDLLRDVVVAERTIGAPPDERRRSLHSLAVAAERAGDLKVAAAALRDASGLATASQRPAIAVDRARVLEKLGHYRSALIVTARALREALTPDVRARLVLSRATVRSFLGDWPGCLRLTRDVLATAPADDRLRAQAHLLAEWCCSCLGLPERATHDAAALAAFTRAGDDVGLGNLHLNRGVSAWGDGRIVEAIADFRASAHHYRRAGDVVGAAMADNNVAEILTLQGRLDEAAALLEHARRVTVAADYRHGQLTTVSGLSRVAAWRGDLAEAAKLQAHALAGFRALAADDYVLDSLLRTAEIHVLDGDPDAALEALDEAAARLDRLGPVPVVPTTLARLRGRALHDAGRRAEALAALDTAWKLADTEGFAYEQALVAVLHGRLTNDTAEARAGRERLAALDVVMVPPVC
jgi:class 3 adenylate cyclase/tetratricopeptide (TPR) repeat protein